jgi:hypothetical protein
MWLWMRPHIRFCTIRKCDLLSFFLAIESLPASYKFHPLFFLLSFWNMELLHMRFHLFCFSIIVPFFFSLSFFSFSLSFLGSFFCWGEIPLIEIFFDNHLVNRIEVGTRNNKDLIWSLWSAWWVMPFSIRIGHYKAWVYEGQKAIFIEGKFNQGFATNSRESTFTKTQQRCKHGKTNHFVHIWLSVAYR